MNEPKKTESSSALWTKATQLRREKKYQKCLAIVVSKDGKKLEVGFADDEKHNAWYLAGVCYFNLQNYSDALRCFKLAEREAQGDRDTFFAIGNCYSELGATDRARWYFGVLIDRDKNDMNARFNLGNTFIDDGNFKEASKVFRALSSRKSSIRSSAKKNLVYIRKQERKKV